jgi:endonuclease YncB( thermonuclease family)
MLPPHANDNGPGFLRTPFERRHAPLVVVAFVLATIVGALSAWSVKRLVAGTLTGHARVVDGDTFDLGAERIRLWGIDAPERGRSCSRRGEPWRPYDEASNALRAILDGMPVTCDAVEREQRGVKPPLIAKCFVAGHDVGELMVRAGWAVDDAHYSRGYYLPLQAEPKAKRLGIWQCDGSQPPTRRWPLRRA